MNILIERKKPEYIIRIKYNELSKIHDELGDFDKGIIALKEKHPTLHRFYLQSLDALVA